MKKKISALVLSVCILFCNAHSFAIDFTPTVDGINEKDGKVTLIVEVEGDPLLASEKTDIGKGKKSVSQTVQKSEIMKTQSLVEDEISDKIGEIEKKYVYTNVLNGFSIEAEFEDIERIEELPYVKSVTIAEDIPVPEPQLTASGELMGTDYAYDELDYHGEGQVICIIDNEFDTNHVFFSHDPENPKCTKDDVQNMIDGTNNLKNYNVTANQVYKNSKIPLAYDYAGNDADTYPESSNKPHGTHVAGIAAGKGGTAPDGRSISGVAPEAQLILMKVGKNISMNNATILAALDDAVLIDEVDVINMSLGAVNAYNSLYDTALLNAKNSGKMICVSAGNDGRGGVDRSTALTTNMEYSTTGMPANAANAFAVASSKNAVLWTNLGRLTINGEDIPFMNTNGSATDFDKTFSNIEMVYCGYGTVSDFENIDLTGKVAVTLRGNESFSVRMERARSKGAIGILYVSDDDYLNVNLQNISGTSGDILPGAIVRNEYQDKVINASSARVKRAYTTDAHIASGGMISDFSSYGTTPLLDLKPEITAPGESIYSSYPDDKYAILSGTSMASPHMTGVCALMNQYIDDTFSVSGSEKVKLSKNLLMSTADIVRYENGTPFSTRAQGSGLVRVDRAMKTPVVLRNASGETKLSLYDKLSNIINLSFYAVNLTDTAVTYDNIEVCTTTDGYTEKDGKNYVSDSVILNNTSQHPQSVTVPANGTALINCTVVLDNSQVSQLLDVFTNGFYVDGFVILSQNSEDVPEISIPFTGFHGNWLDSPFFDSLFMNEDAVTKNFGLLSNFDGKAFYLGQNIYSSNQKLIASADYTVISPNGDGKFDDLLIAPAPLRDLQNLEIKLKNERGTVVKSGSIDNVTKLGSSYYSTSMASGLADGNYTVEFTGTHRYDKLKLHKQTTTVPLVVDTKKPEILSAYVRENNGERVLFAEVKDNFYPAAFAVSGTANGQSESFLYPIDPETDINADGTVRAAFDISGIDYNSLEIGVIDFALNSVEANISEYDEGLIATNVDFVEGTDNIQVKISNYKEETVNCSVLLGIYDDSGKLIGMNICETGLENGDNTINFTNDCDFSNISDMSVFLWDSDLGMVPLNIRQDF